MRFGALGALVVSIALAACEGDPVGEVATDGGADASTVNEAGVDSGPNPWTLIYEDPAAGANDALHDIQLLSENDLWVVGKNQQILHYANGSWDPFSQLPGVNLYGVWGEAPNALTAVGFAPDLAPIVLNYDGVGWISGQPFPPGLPPLTDVWGSGTQRYFTATEGRIYQDDPVGHPNDRYHLAVVTGDCPAGGEPSPTLHAIDGRTFDNILAVGDEGLLAHKDDDGWIRLCGPDQKIHYVSVFQRPGTQHFFVGSNYLGLLWFTSRDAPLAQVYQNLAIEKPEEAYIQRIAGDATRIIGVGDRGVVLYYDFQADPRIVPGPNLDSLYGVALSGDTVYVCGRANRVWRASLAELTAAPL
jgi:hypothetical protein